MVLVEFYGTELIEKTIAIGGINWWLQLVVSIGGIKYYTRGGGRGYPFYGQNFANFKS